jgi:hypothetical protein
MRVEGVSESAVRSAAESLSESLDLLLDRIADRAEQRPPAGSPEWKSAWAARDTESGKRSARRHLLLRIAIATLARVDTKADVEAARLCGIEENAIRQATDGRPPRRSRRTVIHENVAQLSMW